MALEQFITALNEAVAQDGRTRVELATAAGLAPSAISNWLGGGILNPDPHKVFALERALNLPPGHLSGHLGYLPLSAVNGLVRYAASWAASVTSSTTPTGAARRAILTAV